MEQEFNIGYTLRRREVVVTFGNGRLHHYGGAHAPKAIDWGIKDGFLYVETSCRITYVPYQDVASVEVFK